MSASSVVVRGPLVTLTCDFRMGQPLRAWPRRGSLAVISRAHWPFGEDRLYEHQEYSLRIDAAGRFFLVTPLPAIRCWHAWTISLTTGSLASGAGPPGLEALVFLNDSGGGLSRPPSRVW